MLFVLAMEVFNHVLSWLDSVGMLAKLGLAGQVQRVNLYADDLVMFLAPLDQDLHALKSCLRIFGAASGLFANLDKSVATPLHCSEANIALVRQILDCRVEDFPVATWASLSLFSS